MMRVDDLEPPFFFKNPSEDLSDDKKFPAETSEKNICRKASKESSNLPIKYFQIQIFFEFQ
jgi:hypothetical protein